jgi:hypothetical protein
LLSRKILDSPLNNFHQTSGLRHLDRAALERAVFGHMEGDSLANTFRHFGHEEFPNLATKGCPVLPSLGWSV